MSYLALPLAQPTFFKQVLSPADRPHPRLNRRLLLANCPKSTESDQSEWMWWLTTHVKHIPNPENLYYTENMLETIFFKKSATMWLIQTKTLNITFSWSRWYFHIKREPLSWHRKTRHRYKTIHITLSYTCQVSEPRRNTINIILYFIVVECLCVFRWWCFQFRWSR